MIRRSALIAALFAVFVVACATMQNGQNHGAAPSEFKNLQVLHPASHDELINTMRGFSNALGVRCDFCHVPIAGEERKFDFPSDAKPEKKVARTMIRMVSAINQQYIAKLPEQEATVGCMTCHRGKSIPDVSDAGSPEAQH